MFVDASALVAILNREVGWEDLAKRLAEVEGRCLVSPLVRFEATLALARAGAGVGRPTPALIDDARRLVDDLLVEIGARQLAVSADVGEAAIDVARRFGKVVGHPADLNFGDCFSYACARVQGVGLLYKGDDFARTDLA